MSDIVEAEERRKESVIEMARKRYGSDDLEIDSDAKISSSGPDGDNGAWVQAWVWVDFQGTPLDFEVAKARAGLIPHDPADDEPEGDKKGYGDGLGVS